MSNTTLVVPAVAVTSSNSLAAAVQQSFQNDSQQLANSLQLGNSKLSFIEQLIIEQEVWSEGAYKTSNDMLYDLLAKCQAKYEAMCANDEAGNKLRGELNDYIQFHSIAVNKNSHTIIKIVKCVFGANKRRVSAYSIVLRTALFHKVKSTELADFIRANGGVEEIRLAKNGNVLSAKQKAEAAKTVVATTTLAEFTSEQIAQQLDAANIGEQIVFVATQQANGKFVVNAVSNSATAVNAALSAYHSANKDSIKNKQTDLDTTTADEQLTNIVNGTNA